MGYRFGLSECRFEEGEREVVACKYHEGEHTSSVGQHRSVTDECKFIMD